MISNKPFQYNTKPPLGNVGEQINCLVKELFIYLPETNLTGLSSKQKSEIFKKAHRNARQKYFRDTGTMYFGAKESSNESKLEFLRWLEDYKSKNLLSYE